MSQVKKQVRYSFNISETTHGDLKRLAKLNYLTIGQVLDTLIATITPAQKAALEALREKELEERAKLAEARKKISTLNPEQLQFLESLT